MHHICEFQEQPRPLLRRLHVARLVGGVEEPKALVGAHTNMHRGHRLHPLLDEARRRRGLHLRHLRKVVPVPVPMTVAVVGVCVRVGDVTGVDGGGRLDERTVRLCLPLLVQRRLVLCVDLKRKRIRRVQLVVHVVQARPRAQVTHLLPRCPARALTVLFVEDFQRRLHLLQRGDLLRLRGHHVGVREGRVHPEGP